MLAALPGMIRRSSFLKNCQKVVDEMTDWQLGFVPVDLLNALDIDRSVTHLPVLIELNASVPIVIVRGELFMGHFLFHLQRAIGR